MIVSKHSKKRMIERVDTVSSEAEAKRLAKIAFASGKNIAYFQNNPKFADYLRSRKQESNKCIIRVYKGYIYIFFHKPYNSRLILYFHSRCFFYCSYSTLPFIIII